ncbi:MAG TPA: DAHL domain-containing protein [Polyangiaceae bacterium]|nr:DAHL domain-containing protein [Polyangiaceae bacterium]
MSLSRRLSRVGLGAASLAAAVLAAQAATRAIPAAAEAAQRSDLRLLEALDAQLDRELLRSRAGLVLHYDTLTRTFRELTRTAGRVSALPDLAFDPGEVVRRAALRLPELIGAQSKLLERFKTENAILRNSRQYYPVLLDQARATAAAEPSGEPRAAQLAALLGALSFFDVAPAGDASARLASALAELERQSGSAAPSTREELELVVHHGHVILERSASVDQLVAELLAVPLGEEMARASAAYEESYRHASVRAEHRIELLTALVAIAVVLGLTEVIAKFRADARALARARDALELQSAALDRERQREKQQNELKTRFVSATSHEFRTPLTTILSSTQMLSAYGERWDAERRLTHFDRIGSAASQMLEMLDELLLIGRAEMGMLAASPGELDLREFCEDLLESQSRAHAGRTIELSYAGERRAWLDRRLLTHVLGNLIENALKYSAAHEPVGLRVTLSSSELRFDIDDRGVGIADADVPHLFQSFYRGQNVGAVTGTGLGLAVVKRALDVQGGNIEVHSQPGKGTTVSVRVPVAPAADGDRSHGGAPLATSGANGQRAAAPSIVERAGKHA